MGRKKLRVIVVVVVVVVVVGVVGVVVVIVSHLTGNTDGARDQDV